MKYDIKFWLTAFREDDEDRQFKPGKTFWVKDINFLLARVIYYFTKKR